MTSGSCPPRSWDIRVADPSISFALSGVVVWASSSVGESGGGLGTDHTVAGTLNAAEQDGASSCWGDRHVMALGIKQLEEQTAEVGGRDRQR